ncbi:MAG: hypothetical protein RR835_07800, partial [Peptostreptococcaceae bacterium]
FNINKELSLEEVLIKQSQQGDDNAFEKLIDKYEEYLYKMAFLYVKNEQDSMDVFEKSMENNNYKVKNGIVYDSVVDENIYKIGYHDVNEFLTIRFENFKNEENGEVIEFKVNISKYK